MRDYLLVRAQDIMRPVASTIAVDSSFSEALRMFQRNDCRELIILDEDEVVGFMDDNMAFNIAYEIDSHNDEILGNLMEYRIGNCRPEDSATDIRRLFIRRDLRIVAVVDKRRRLRGWISPNDILDVNHD